jgi:hypothetical protein
VENRHEPVDDREAVARRVSAAIRTLSAGVSSLYTNHSEAFFKTAFYPAEGKVRVRSTGSADFECENACPTARKARYTRKSCECIEEFVKLSSATLTCRMSHILTCRMSHGHSYTSQANLSHDQRFPTLRPTRGNCIILSKWLIKYRGRSGASAPSEYVQLAQILELAEHFPMASSSGGRLSTRPQHSVR